MKRIIVSLSLLMTIGVATISAAPITTPDPRVEKVFKKEFAGAENVKWSEEEGFVSALFLLNGHRIQAWFKKEGELVGSIRGLSYNQLPLLVIRSLQARFEQAIMIEMREVTNSDGTLYKLVLENKDKKYKVSIKPDGSIEQAQRVKK